MTNQTNMKAFLLTMGSLVLTAGVISNAYIQKQQFYPSVVYITKSSPSKAVLYVQAFVFVILMGKMVRKLFFGQLRAAEMEHLIERSWYAVTETCLAFTVFRDDFSPKFVALFTLLLFIKCFHWLAEDRVDYMERSPVISLLFHVRVVSLLLVLGALDAYFINHAYHSTLIKGASVQLVFGFEYAILMTVVFHIFVKYILHSIDLQSENPWENKAVYLLYTELVLGFIKVVLYVLFLAIMIKVHTFPLFAIRPMYLTMRAFKKALHDVIMSRRAIRNMNTLYPDATPEELAAGDNVCIICREEMLAGCKKLPCNHIFHTTCLRSWFQRQQTCPTCRMDILRPQAARTAAQPAQPAAAQPQQQPPPQAPGFPPFPNMPGFPAWPHQQPQAAPVAPPAAGAAGGGAPPTPGGPAPHTPASPGSPPPPSTPAPGAPPGMMPPFMMPPMMGMGMGMPPMMGMPFGVPPPMPPPDYSGLSEEELRAMEGAERAAVEARVQCLRNIQVLLDAAMVQISQYSNVVANLGYPPTPGASSSQPPPEVSTSTASPSTTSPSTTHNVTNTTLTESKPEATSASVLKSPAPSATEQDSSAKNIKTEADDASEEGAVGFTSPKGVDDVTEEQGDVAHDESEESMNEIRRRRLERFSSNGKAGSES